MLSLYFANNTTKPKNIQRASKYEFKVENGSLDIKKAFDYVINKKIDVNDIDFPIKIS